MPYLDSYRYLQEKVRKLFLNNTAAKLACHIAWSDRQLYNNELQTHPGDLLHRKKSLSLPPYFVGLFVRF